jgi:hypothetical protein
MIRAFAAAALILTAIPSAIAASQDGALVGLHDLRREGNKLCMSDHSHSGSSAGAATRARAEVEAQRSWSSFTALEYGDHWGSPALASSKAMSCAQGSGGWSCNFEARPCRR